jgi:hypothetical protein
MSNTEYLTVAGLVQFDPRSRDAGGKQVRDVVIKSIGGNKQISITIWPDFAHVPVNKGDFIVADGSYTSKVAQDKEGKEVTYHNLSANVLFVAASAQKAGQAAPSAPAAPKPGSAEAISDENIPF